MKAPDPTQNTPETRQRVAEILGRVVYGQDARGAVTFIQWDVNKREAFDIVRRVFGYVPSKRGCLACNLQVLNYLREIAGEAPIGGEASASLTERRLSICRGVKGDGTDACEHLAWPGLNCGKCGCFIDIKARFKSFRCPINLWPTA